jgi:hypothetical protein
LAGTVNVVKPKMFIGIGSLLTAIREFMVRLLENERLVASLSDHRGIMGRKKIIHPLKAP